VRNKRLQKARTRIKQTLVQRSSRRISFGAAAVVTNFTKTDEFVKRHTMRTEMWNAPKVPKVTVRNVVNVWGDTIAEDQAKASKSKEQKWESVARIGTKWRAHGRDKGERSASQGEA